MRSLEFEAQAIRQQLERVLESPGFSRNERLSRFLRFVVEGHLDGKDNELKESVIAVQVFGRRPDFDSRLDPVVRTEAVRLRARLSEYYIKEGKADGLVIELPKGGYVPRFREVEQERPVIAPIPAPTLARLGTRLWVALGLACLVVGLGAAGWWWNQQRRAPIPIAVLPLENTNHDPANDYFADGLTDELIRKLSIIDGLTVRSRTSSFGVKGRPRNIRDAGQQLQADYILEGSVLRSGQRLRIDVQLIRVRDDFPLWSGQFDKELTDVFAIQDDISLGIVNNLRLKLGHGRRRYETSVEAYDLYLQARSLPQRTSGDARVIVGLYQQVIAKDASFAPAYAGLAAAYAAISLQQFYDHTDDLMQMRAAAEKAMRLDPLSAEAHQAMGMVYARDGQWARSEKSFRRAIELDPGDSLAYSDLAMNLLLPLGRIEDGIHEMQMAEKTDPLSAEAHQAMGMVYARDGQWARSEKSFRRAIELDPGDSLAYSDLAMNLLLPLGRIEDGIHEMQMAEKTDPLSPWIHNTMAWMLLSAGRYGEAAAHCGKGAPPQCLARARLGQGRIGEAIQILATANTQYLGYAYGRAGRRDEAEKFAAAAAPNAFTQALTFAGLGDKDRTLEALDRLASNGAVRVGRALNSPEFALLRGNPQVKALRKKVGLPE